MFQLANLLGEFIFKFYDLSIRLMFWVNSILLRLLGLTFMWTYDDFLFFKLKFKLLDLLK